VVYFGPDPTYDCWGGRRKEYVAITDRRGAYSLLVPHGEWPLTVRHPDQVRYSEAEPMAQGPMVAGEIRADFQFELYRVNVRVVNPRGLPISTGTITYYRVRPGMFCGTGLPEAHFTNGSVELFLHKRDNYIFWTRASDLGPSVWPSIPIAGDTTVQITLGGHSVSGFVRGMGSQPMSGALVNAYGPGSSTVYTDSLGRYEMSLPSGSYRWRVEPREANVQSWTQQATFIQDSARIDLSLDGVEWSGTVLEDRNRSPVDSVWVSIHEGGREVISGYARCLTAQGGAFRLVLQKGKTFDMYLVDSRMDTARLPDETPGTPEFAQALIRSEYLHARVLSRWILGLQATRDSTFSVTLESTGQESAPKR
jgi:hypothetical protein